MIKEIKLYNNGSAAASTRLANPTFPLRKFCTIAIVCMLVSISTPTFAAAPLKAFACAQGFGATSTGGRGGDVYHVTNLSDNLSVGTLRYGIEKTKGPRTIVFDIGGIINLKKPLTVSKSNITIAGQTAPGGGITLAGSRFAIANSSNVIIRYMRFRIGDYNGRYGKYGAPDKGPVIGNGNKHMYAEGGDAITVFRANNVIFDHVSASWGMDETVEIAQSKNITFQHSIISEGLYHSFHPKGVHSMGLVISNGNKDGVTIYQNLLAHNNWRNPLVSGKGNTIAVDFTNNVVYDWGEYSGHGSQPKMKLNYINNYLIAGPSTTPRNLNTAMAEFKSYEGQFYIYQAGNYMDTDKDRAHDGKPVGREAFPGFEANERLTKRLPWPKIDQVFSAEGAYQNILKNVGASLVRDNVDRRVINEVRNRTGGLIDSQDEVGGLGFIAKGNVPFDTDRDGMPDNWEKANGLDPKNALDRNRTNLSNEGYTNLEVYLDSIVASTGHCAVGNNVKPAFIPDSNISGNSSKILNSKPSQSSTSISVWNDSDNPVNTTENDYRSVELGVKFISDTDGFIEGIRFYKGKVKNGKHVGNLWTSSGQLLASATFTRETATGWQQVFFDEPVAIKKDTVYVASYHAPNGRYADDNYFFKLSGIDNGPLHLLKSGVSGANGVYAYGNSDSVFPNKNWLHTNYWVDVFFKSN
jgi:uncharacterized protein DUF4082